MTVSCAQCLWSCIAQAEEMMKDSASQTGAICICQFKVQVVPTASGLTIDIRPLPELIDYYQTPARC